MLNLMFAVIDPVTIVVVQFIVNLLLVLAANGS
jgi:hypothetical protein